MTKIVIIGIAVFVVLLFGASAVMAQDGVTGTTGHAVCPIGSGGVGQTADGQPVGPGMMGGANQDEMRQAMSDAMQNGNWQQMHDAMGQYVPEGMKDMHDAMGQAMQNGDVQQMHDTCQGYMNGQTQTSPEPQAGPDTPTQTGPNTTVGPGSMMGGGNAGPGSMMGGRNA